MAVHARDLGAPLHLGKTAPQHRRHHENMGDAVTRQHVREHLGADALGIVSEHHDYWFLNSDSTTDPATAVRAGMKPTRRSRTRSNLPEAASAAHRNLCRYKRTGRHPWASVRLPGARILDK